MKKILVSAVVVVIALFLSGCAMMKTHDSINTSESKMLYDNTVPLTVVIAGGFLTSDIKFMEPLKKGISGPVFGVVPNGLIPKSVAAENLYLQIIEILKEKGIKGRIIMVAGSFAGLPSRILTAQHPELVVALITIGSPAGGYPKSVNEFFFGTGDNNKTPLYVIASDDDWVVSTKSALDLWPREVTDQKIFSGVGHFGLFKDTRVIAQVNTWVELERVKYLVRNQTPEKQPTLLIGVK